MATTTEQFHTELFEQHLEEASFLYEQRLALFDDPEVSWREREDFEERFEAHIDALVVGRDHALEVCKARCSAGDFGELHAALRVFCRQRQPALAYAVLQTMEYGDADVVRAVIDALKAECPEDWHDDLARIMLGSRKELIPVLAAVLAYRRVPIEDTLLRALPSCPDEHLAHTFWALGRVGSTSSTSVLGNYLKSEDDATAAAACRALIRLGDYHAVRHGLLVAQLKNWPVLSLGLAGNHAAVNVLTDVAKSDAVTDEVLIALGLLGDLGSVKTIFECLTNADRAMAAAEALQMITGADLYEQVFVPEEIDPDELLDEEREAYEKTGEIPQHPNGEPAGTTIEQLSIDPERWRAWLSENKQRFDAKLRYRLGHPYSPAALLQSLAAERTAHRVRELICDELVVRYAAPVTLEADMPASEQIALLQGLKPWLAEHQRRFAPGQWYFAGRPID